MKLEKDLRNLYNKHHDKPLNAKYWHLRLLDPSDNERLTGYTHNAVEPFMLKTKMPCIISESINS